MTLLDTMPAPSDDGSCDHLPGLPVPSVVLEATVGTGVDLAALDGRSVLYAYPRTGPPGEPELVPDWDLIPGARGCSEEACGFRDHRAELLALGARVFGLSTQTTAEQQELVERLHLTFPLLSDAGLALTGALRLPTFEVAGHILLKRQTLIVRDGVVEHVFYPVFPPDRHADEVCRWLEHRD